MSRFTRSCTLELFSLPCVRLLNARRARNYVELILFARLLRPRTTKLTQKPFLSFSPRKEHEEQGRVMLLRDAADRWGMGNECRLDSVCRSCLPSYQQQRDSNPHMSVCEWKKVSFYLILNENITCHMGGKDVNVLCVGCFCDIFRAKFNFHIIFPHKESSLVMLWRAVYARDEVLV